MAKTELTKRIEEKLKSYRPKELDGYKLNYMRDQYGMNEVPVTHGSVTNGLVDYVWLAEGFINEHTEYYCAGPNYAKSGWDHLNVGINCSYTAEAFKNMNESPVIDEFCTHCRNKRMMVVQDDTPAVICFEIKISKSDFHSGHGHNFIGNLNYYVMPIDLYKEVSDEIPEDIGCIVLLNSDKQDILRKRKSAIWHEIDTSLYSSMLLTCMNKYRKEWTKQAYELRGITSAQYDIIYNLVKDNTVLKREREEKPDCYVDPTIKDYMLRLPQYYQVDKTNCENQYKELPMCNKCIFNPAYIKNEMNRLCGDTSQAYIY